MDLCNICRKGANEPGRVKCEECNGTGIHLLKGNCPEHGGKLRPDCALCRYNTDKKEDCNGCDGSKKVICTAPIHSAVAQDDERPEDNPSGASANYPDDDLEDDDAEDDNAGRIDCESCRGTGIRRVSDCERCYGSGKGCLRCNGTGEETGDCIICNGDGHVLPRTDEEEAVEFEK